MNRNAHSLFYHFLPLVMSAILRLLFVFDVRSYTSSTNISCTTIMTTPSYVTAIPCFHRSNLRLSPRAWFAIVYVFLNTTVGPYFLYRLFRLILYGVAINRRIIAILAALFILHRGLNLQIRLHKVRSRMGEDYKTATEMNRIDP